MSKILKLETLTDNFGDDAETFVQILDVFLKEVPEDFELLKKYIEEGDFQNSGGIAHKIKSSYRLLDMDKETTLLQEIESRAKNQKNTEEIKDIFKQFELNYTSGFEAVKQTREHYNGLYK